MKMKHLFRLRYILHILKRGSFTTGKNIVRAGFLSVVWSVICRAWVRTVLVTWILFILMTFASLICMSISSFIPEWLNPVSSLQWWDWMLIYMKSFVMITKELTINSILINWDAWLHTLVTHLQLATLWECYMDGSMSIFPSSLRWDPSSNIVSFLLSTLFEYFSTMFYLEYLIPVREVIVSFIFFDLSTFRTTTWYATTYSSLNKLFHTITMHYWDSTVLPTSPADSKLFIGLFMIIIRYILSWWFS